MGSGDLPDAWNIRRTIVASLQATITALVSDDVGTSICGGKGHTILHLNTAAVCVRISVVHRQGRKSSWKHVHSVRARTTDGS